MLAYCCSFQLLSLFQTLFSLQLTRSASFPVTFPPRLLHSTFAHCTFAYSTFAPLHLCSSPSNFALNSRTSASVARSSVLQLSLIAGSLADPLTHARPICERVFRRIWNR